MPKRALLGVVAAAVVAVVAILLARRGADGTTSPAPRPAAAAPRAQPATSVVEGTQPIQQYDDDPPGALRLEGQVIDEAEHPIANATVVIDANPPREIQTEADGAFAFDGLTPRTYRVAARASTAMAGPVAVRLGQATEPIVLRLREGARIGVTVRTDGGRPVRGALVELRDLVSVTDVTDDEGNVVLRGVPGGWHLIKVSADGYASAFAEGYASAFAEIASTGDPGAERRTQVVLRAGTSVAGAVVDSSGAPIEGARVLPEHVGHVDDLYDGRYDGVVTDAKGRWRLMGLPRETTRILAHHAAFAPGASVPLVLADGDRSGVTIVLERGGRVHGRVLDSSGAPVAGAEVRIAADTVITGHVRRVAADAGGSFQMAGLPRAMMYAVAAADGAASKLQPLDLRGTGAAELTLQLDQAAEIAGVVVTGAGAPVAEARVVAERARAEDGLERLEDRLRGAAGTVAGIDGAFRITGLQPGGYVLRAIRPGSASHLLHARVGIPVQTGAAGIKVVVDDLSALVGRVAMPDGRAVTRFGVQLGIGALKWFSTTDGAFRVDEVPTGKQFVRISGPDHVRHALPDVVVEAGKPTDLGTITVQPGRTIRGAVVDASGRPIAGATIVLGREIYADGTSIAPYSHAGMRQLASSADGHFEIRGIGPGMQQIAADHETAGRSPMQPIADGTADVELTLTVRPTGALQGFVRSFGKPIEALVILRPIGTAANSRLTVRTGLDGSYRFDRLAGDRYTHMTYQEGATRDERGDAKVRQVEIKPGQTATMDVDLTPSGVAVVVHLASPGNVVAFGYGLVAMIDDTGWKPTALPKTLTEARAFAGMAKGFETREGLVVDKAQIKFERIRVGRHVTCMTPLRGDPKDPSVRAEMQLHAVDWPLYCKWIDVAAAPDPQHFTVEVQPLPPPKP